MRNLTQMFRGFRMGEHRIRPIPSPADSKGFLSVEIKVTLLQLLLDLGIAMRQACPQGDCGSLNGGFEWKRGEGKCSVRLLKSGWAFRDL